MKDLLDQIQAAKEAGLYYISLLSALLVPEICAALESTNGETEGKKYAAWFDKNVSPRYTVRGVPSLSGWDAYRFRCRMLHQPAPHAPSSPISRIIFVEPGSSGIDAHNNRIFDILNIDARRFVEDVVEAALLWLDRVEHTPLYKTNRERFASRYPEGLPPFMGGTPIIS